MDIEGVVRTRPWVLAVLLVAAAAAGYVGGLFTEAEAVSIQRFRSFPRMRFVIPEYIKYKQPPTSSYSVLSSSVWSSTMWGRNCSKAQNLTAGEKVMCQLPETWKNCTQGIYVDIGTNVGGQIRKIYDAWQFPNATAMPLFDKTYGVNRTGVCSIGVEANPVHTPYLTTLNAYFKRKGYQAIVLVETAAAINTRMVTLYQDHGSPVEWGASMAKGSWQRQNNSTANEVAIPTLDVPAFVADIVRPLVREIQRRTGVRPPVGMKIDAEGAEYALLPALITNGGLCDLSMIYLEPHQVKMRAADAAAVDMTLAAMEDAFTRMRRANPRCTVNYSHLDDESYLHAHTQVPLPP